MKAPVEPSHWYLHSYIKPWIMFEAPPAVQRFGFALRASSHCCCDGSLYGADDSDHIYRQYFRDSSKDSINNPSYEKIRLHHRKILHLFPTFEKIRLHIQSGLYARIDDAESMPTRLPGFTKDAREASFSFRGTCQY